MDEFIIRKQRLESLRSQGHDPYPSDTRRTHSIEEVLNQFTALQKNATAVTVCGRVMTIRRHGGSTFLTLRDNAYNLQAYYKQDTVGFEKYRLLDDLDIGDFLEVTGALFVTHKGEKTILAQA